MGFAKRHLPALVFAAAVLVMSGPWGASDVTGRAASPFLEALGFSPALAQAAHAVLRKVGHACAYAVFALLARRAAAGPRPARARDGWIAFALAVALASADEGIQHFTVGRGASVMDVVLDSAGAGGALLLASSFAKRRRRSEKDEARMEVVVPEAPTER